MLNFQTINSILCQILKANVFLPGKCGSPEWAAQTLSMKSGVSGPLTLYPGPITSYLTPFTVSSPVVSLAFAAEGAKGATC